MPTENEIRVMKVLTAIEIDPLKTAQKIKEWGNEAVSVVAEAALGVYPGMRLKVRTNAVALLGWIDHPQAAETLALLVNDANQDVAIRALRAAGRRKDDTLVDYVGSVLTRANTSPILAAEAAKALIAIGTGKSQAALQAYEAANSEQYPHRASAVVRDVLQKRRRT